MSETLKVPSEDDLRTTAQRIAESLLDPIQQSSGRYYSKYVSIDTEWVARDAINPILKYIVTTIVPLFVQFKRYKNSGTNDVDSSSDACLNVVDKTDTVESKSGTYDAESDDDEDDYLEYTNFDEVDDVDDVEVVACYKTQTRYNFDNYDTLEDVLYEEVGSYIGSELINKVLDVYIEALGGVQESDGDENVWDDLHCITADVFVGHLSECFEQFLDE